MSPYLSDWEGRHLTQQNRLMTLLMLSKVVVEDRQSRCLSAFVAVRIETFRRPM